MSGKLLVLIGCARSGKSTYAANWLMREPHKKVVVNSDMIRLALHGQRYIKSAEPFVHATCKLMVKTLFIDGYAVMVDETNTSLGSIKQWIEMDPQAEFIYLDTPIEECLRRATLTGQGDLHKVIPRMYQNLVNLIRENHPMGADNIYYYDEELLTAERLYETIESIRKDMKNDAS